MRWTVGGYIGGAMSGCRSDTLARRCLEAIWFGHFFHRNWWYLMDVALGIVALLATCVGCGLTRAQPRQN